MKGKQLWSGVGAGIGMLILILDGRTALEGVRAGIDLCLRTVIPSLFPFSLLSIVLTGSLAGYSPAILRPVGKLCGIPRGAESILITGFLGGYPVGAQSVAAAYRSGQLSRSDAQRMLAFCSNAGPAFLFGMVSAMFPRRWMVWTLWGIHMGSAILVSLLLPRHASVTANVSPGSSLSLTNSLWSALRVMASVCGWVVLFRVVIAFLNRWVLWLLPVQAQVAVIGLLELSNGCCELLTVSDIHLRFVLCSGMLAFGGLCIAMQTASVTEGLPLGSYILGKLLQGFFSLLLAAAVVGNLWLPCCTGLAIFILILRNGQKRGSIPKAVGV